MADAAVLSGLGLYSPRGEHIVLFQDWCGSARPRSTLTFRRGQRLVFWWSLGAGGGLPWPLCLHTSPIPETQAFAAFAVPSVQDALPSCLQMKM